MTNLIPLLILLGTSIGVLVDAKKIGVRSRMLPGMLGSGPWGWFFGSLLVWIVVFPLYLFYARPRYLSAVRTTPKGKEDLAAGTHSPGRSNMPAEPAATIAPPPQTLSASQK